MAGFIAHARPVGWMVPHTEHFVVRSAQSTEFGDATIDLTGGYRILVFPASSRDEAWRFFTPGDDGEHTVFPRKLN